MVERRREVPPSLRCADTPWGTLPFLEVDGKRIGGSPVIARFLSERFGKCCCDRVSGGEARAVTDEVCSVSSGLAGSDDVENAQIAAVLVAVGDVATEVLKMVYEEDEGKKVWSASVFKVP